jgi:hypothetical protein
VNVGWTRALASRRLSRLGSSAARPSGVVDAQCGEHQDRLFFSTSRCRADRYIVRHLDISVGSLTVKLSVQARSSIVTGNSQTPVVLQQGSLQATTRTTECIRKWIGLPLLGLRRTTPRHLSRPPIRRQDSVKKQASPPVLSADILVLRLGRWKRCRHAARERRRDGPLLRPKSQPVPRLSCARNPLLCALRAVDSRSATRRPNRVLQPTIAQGRRQWVRSQTGGSGACQWVHSRQTRRETRPYIDTGHRSAAAAYPRIPPSIAG